MKKNLEGYIEGKIVKFTIKQNKILRDWQYRMMKYDAYHPYWDLRNIIINVYKELSTRQKNILYQDNNDYVVETLLQSIIISFYGIKDNGNIKVNRKFRLGVKDLYENNKIKDVLLWIKEVEQDLQDEGVNNFLDQAPTKINTMRTIGRWHEN